MITFWHSPVPALVCPGILLPVMVGIARFAPIAAIILFVQIRFIDPIMFDAADVFSPDPLIRWGGIRLPLFAPGFSRCNGDPCSTYSCRTRGNTRCGTSRACNPDDADLQLPSLRGCRGSGRLMSDDHNTNPYCRCITVTALYWLYRKPQDMTGHGGY